MKNIWILFENGDRTFLVYAENLHIVGTTVMVKRRPGAPHETLTNVKRIEVGFTTVQYNEPPTEAEARGKYRKVDHFFTQAANVPDVPNITIVCGECEQDKPMRTATFNDFRWICKDCQDPTSLTVSGLPG